MPRTAIGEIGAVRKLEPSDEGYVEGEQLFEVEMQPERAVRKRLMNVQQIDARLAQVRANKARAMAMWDGRIEKLTNIKAALESA